MSVTYDTLLASTQPIQYVSGATSTTMYPDSNIVSIAGPMWLPRIYGKDLTAFEIASSGKIAISLNDIHTLDITRSTYINSSNFKNTLVSQSNYSFEMTANGNDLQIMMDTYSNNINIHAASNMSLVASSGNMNVTASNNFLLSASNNYSVVAKSNVSLNAAKGSATISANNSNMYITLDQVTNNASVYSSNDVAVSACNSIGINASSNITLGALGGDFKAYSDASNMYLTMEKSSDTVSLFTSSNLIINSSNHTSMTGKSNITIGALAGDFKAYADASNMFLTMEKSTDNVTLYTASNIIVSASNNYSLNATSNVLVGTLAGDVVVTANNSNMFVTMSAATNNVSIFASNNLNVSVSNDSLVTVNSNVKVNTIAGDYILNANDSNMFMRMSAATNSIAFFSSNNTVMSASNNLNIFARSNMSVSTVNGSVSLAANSSNMFVSLDSATNDVTVFSSNNMKLSASNSFSLNTQSNAEIGAVAGSFKAYADSSNMYLVMDKTTDNVSLFGISNVDVTASNSFNLVTKSNVSIFATSGDVLVAANQSNMTLTMAQSTNNITAFASNNFDISASNSFNTYVNSNAAISTVSGSITLSGNSSNMFMVMDHTTNDTSLFTSNNLIVSSSNSFNTFVNSNVTVSTTAGSYQLYVNSSNMFLTMDAATNNTTLYSSNNLQVSVSNNTNVNVLSNINIGALSGDVKLYANSSNTFLTLEKTTNTATLFASNDIVLSASNDYRVNANSNVLISAINGDMKLYSKSSNMHLIMDSTVSDVSLYALRHLGVSASNNMALNSLSNVAITAGKGSLSMSANSSNLYMTLDRATNNLTTYASNDILVSASNSLTMSTYSNVSVSAGLGDLKLYSANSNMYVTMDATTRNTTVFSSNDFQITASNSGFVNVQSNLLMGALAGDFKVYADASNMYMTMDKTTDNINVYTASNFVLVSSNNTSLTSKSNVTVGALAGDFKVYADSSNMYMTMNSSTDNIAVYASSNIGLTASNSFTLNAKSNVLVGALSGSTKLYANGSNMFMTLDATTSSIAVFASNNASVSASNSVDLVGHSNVSITAVVRDVTVSASNNIIVSASNDYVQTARSNVTINASKGSFVAYSDDSNMFLTMDHVTDTVKLYGLQDVAVTSSNTMTLAAHSNLFINALNGSMAVYADSNLSMSVDDSNMYMKFDMPSDLITIHSLSNVQVSASNNLFISAMSNVSLTTSNMNFLSHGDIRITASNDLYLTGSNNLNFNFTNMNMTSTGDQNYTALSNIKFFITSDSNQPTDPVFTVKGSQVTIKGDIVVTGSINTSNVFNTTVIQESLKVNDKFLTLASIGSNFAALDGPDDGIANSGAGIKIDGVPVGFDSNIPEAYEKSMLWNYGTGNGIADLGTANGLESEPFWELKGGSFKVTHQKIIAAGGSNIVTDVTFGLRINELDELEMIKRFWYSASNAYVVKRVARFGRII